MGVVLVNGDGLKSCIARQRDCGGKFDSSTRGWRRGRSRVTNTSNLGTGTSVKQCGPVAICCMKTDYAECLDGAMAAWRKHWENLPINHRPKDPDDVYGFAYWLIRYSGFVVPVAKVPNA